MPKKQPTGFQNSPPTATDKAKTTPNFPSKPSGVNTAVTSYNLGNKECVVEVLCPLDVWRKLMAYVTLCPNNNEISGLGYVRRIGAKTIVIDDVFLLKQEVSVGNATFDPAAYRDYTVWLADENDAREERKEPPLMPRLQWHSHGNGVANFSPQDEIVLNNAQTEWRVSLCVNTKGDFVTRLDVYKPFRCTIKTEFQIVLPEISEEVIASYRKEIEELVTERKVEVVQQPHAYNGMYGGLFGDRYPNYD